MPTQPTVTKTLRIPYALHDAALQHKRPGESFTAYINRLIAQDMAVSDWEKAQQRKNAQLCNSDDANIEMGLPPGIPWGNK